MAHSTEQAERISIVRSYRQLRCTPNSNSQSFFIVEVSKTREQVLLIIRTCRHHGHYAGAQCREAADATAGAYDRLCRLRDLAVPVVGEKSLSGLMPPTGIH